MQCGIIAKKVNSRNLFIGANRFKRKPCVDPTTRHVEPAMAMGLLKNESRNTLFFFYHTNVLIEMSIDSFIPISNVPFFYTGYHIWSLQLFIMTLIVALE